MSNPTTTNPSSSRTSVSSPSVSGRPPAAKRSLRWRVVDIAVASVIAVASAFIFWGASFLSNFFWSPLEAIVPGFAGITNGLWLFAGPLAGLVVRKPGAALYAELIAGCLEAQLGNQWGVENLTMGLIEGAFAELAFLIVAYRVWNMAIAALSGALTGLSCWGYSFFTHLQGISLTGPYGVWYLVTTVISGAVIAGILMWELQIALARTGALDRFESGRQFHSPRPRTARDSRD